MGSMLCRMINLFKRSSPSFPSLIRTVETRWGADNTIELLSRQRVQPCSLADFGHDVVTERQERMKRRKKTGMLDKEKS